MIANVFNNIIPMEVKLCSENEFPSGYFSVKNGVLKITFT
jgi:hypothetical protein